MQETVSRRVQRSTERRFHAGFIVVIVVAVLLGFSRTFFLTWWFPEWAAAHSPMRNVLSLPACRISVVRSLLCT